MFFRNRQLLLLIIQKLNQMNTQLDALKQQVAQNQSVTQSAVALLQGLKQKLDDAIASNDPAALQALSDALGADNASLADAIAANTPADTTATDANVGTLVTPVANA